MNGIAMIQERIDQTNEKIEQELDLIKRGNMRLEIHNLLIDLDRAKIKAGEHICALCGVVG